MTRQKGFKRLVRERMARTGERYAAARRVLEANPSPTQQARPHAEPSGYAYRGGVHPETASLANVLAAGGTTSGLTGQPLSEAALLTVGGGLGAGYILWEWQRHQHIVLTLGFKNRWQYPATAFDGAIERLGLEAETHETGGARSARDRLDALVEAGVPAIVTVDQGSIGTWGLPEAMSGYLGYPVVVTGRTASGGYRFDDRGVAPLEVSAETMAVARARIGSYKHRLLRVTARPQAIPADRLRDAFRAGIEDQVAHLRSASDSFGLPAWRKWSRLLVDTRNAKAWPRVFAGRVGLFGALLSAVEAVDGDVGGTGGHLRELQAAGLDEAAAALDRPALADAAARWRTAGDLWEDFADAAVPPDLDGATEAVEAAEALREAVELGEAGRARGRAAAERVWAARDRYAGSFPLDDDRVAALFADLSSRLAEIHAAEQEALDATAAAIRR
jgi:hypothetical protein